jgi:hypothetical protein
MACVWVDGLVIPASVKEKRDEELSAAGGGAVSLRVVKPKR